jgi:hypothetical protein
MHMQQQQQQIASQFLMPRLSYGPATSMPTMFMPQLHTLPLTPSLFPSVSLAEAAMKSPLTVFRGNRACAGEKKCSSCGITK